MGDISLVEFLEQNWHEPPPRIEDYKIIARGNSYLSEIMDELRNYDIKRVVIKPSQEKGKI